VRAGRLVQDDMQDDWCHSSVLHSGLPGFVLLAEKQQFVFFKYCFFINNYPDLYKFIGFRFFALLMVLKQTYPLKRC